MTSEVAYEHVLECFSDLVAAWASIWHAIHFAVLINCI